MEKQSIIPIESPLSIAYQKPLVVNNSKDCLDIFKSIWDSSTMNRHERIYVIYLNYKKEVVRNDLVGIGNHAACTFDIRSILEYALTSNAEYIAVAHNHVIGDVKPSKADLSVTEKLYLLLNSIDIKLLDHLILTEDNYFSFRDNKLLN